MLKKVKQKTPDKQYITIGKILGTYGNKGWVRVLPLTDFPERFLTMNKVLLFQNNQLREYNLLAARKYKQFITILFKEAPDMNAAVALKGALLQISREQLIKLPKGSYYIFDLIGIHVYTTDLEFLGELKDVLKTGANDVYVVENKEGRSLLIPALKQVVNDIDLNARRMVVQLPKGL